jgi:hypothetical protein
MARIDQRHSVTIDRVAPTASHVVASHVVAPLHARIGLAAAVAVALLLLGAGLAGAAPQRLCDVPPGLLADQISRRHLLATAQFVLVTMIALGDRLRRPV